MATRNHDAAKRIGRVVEDWDDGPIRFWASGRLSSDESTITIKYDAEGQAWEMKVERSRISRQLWTGHGSSEGNDGIKLRLEMRITRFLATRGIMLEGEWIDENPAGKSDLDRRCKMIWELWPFGKDDPFVEKTRKHSSRKKTVRTKKRSSSRAGVRTRKNK